MKPAQYGDWLLQQVACPDCAQPCLHRGLHCPAEPPAQCPGDQMPLGWRVSQSQRQWGQAWAFPDCVLPFAALLAQDTQETTTSSSVISPLLMTPPEPAQPGPAPGRPWLP